MDAAAELGRDPAVSKHQIQPEYGDEQADAGQVCRIRLVRQILRRERGQGNIYFPCSADHEQDWQLYPVDPYSCHMLFVFVFLAIHSGHQVRWTYQPGSHPHGKEGKGAGGEQG